MISSFVEIDNGISHVGVSHLDIPVVRTGPKIGRPEMEQSKT